MTLGRTGIDDFPSCIIMYWLFRVWFHPLTLPWRQSPSSPWAVVDIVIVFIFFHHLFTFWGRLRRGLPYPPGPKPWPIIGNLLDSLKGSQWTAYIEMSKEDGLGNVTARWCAPFTEASFHICQATFAASKFLGKLSYHSALCPWSKADSKSAWKFTQIVLLRQCNICCSWSLLGRSRLVWLKTVPMFGLSRITWKMSR